MALRYSFMTQVWTSIGRHSPWEMRLAQALEHAMEAASAGIDPVAEPCTCTVCGKVRRWLKTARPRRLAEDLQEPG